MISFLKILLNRQKIISVLRLTSKVIEFILKYIKDDKIKEILFSIQRISNKILYFLTGEQQSYSVSDQEIDVDELQMQLDELERSI